MKLGSSAVRGERRGSEPDKARVVGGEVSFGGDEVLL